MNTGRIIASAAAVVAALAVLAGSGSNTSADAAAAIYPALTIGQGTQCMLGGWSGGQWVQGDVLSTKVSAGTRYKLYSLAGYLGTSVGGKPESIGEPCDDVYNVTVTPKRTSKYEIVGVAGTWAAMPRLPRIESNNQPVYVKAVGDALKKEGLANPKVNITQVIRVDLDGDGANEVLITANHFKDANDEGTPAPSVSAGDYSLILMRKVVKGQVVTVTIASAVYKETTDFSAPTRYDISNVLDLNGDKKMELVVRGRYYEGDWHSVLQVNGTDVKEVMGCGCGA